MSTPKGPKKVDVNDALVAQADIGRGMAEAAPVDPVELRARVEAARARKRAEARGADAPPNEDGAPPPSEDDAPPSEASDGCEGPDGEEEDDDLAGGPAAGRCTEFANAHRFLARFGRDVLRCEDWDKWLTWDGTRWARDTTRRTFDMALSIPSIIREEAGRIRGSSDEAQAIRSALMKWSYRSETARATSSALVIAGADRRVARTPEAFDAESTNFLVNCRNGTLDLNTGELRPHRRADLITKALDLPYLPAAKCPRFERFLSEIMLGREELVSYLQRALGYTLSGSCKEQVFWVLWGEGENGKGVLTKTFQRILGDYSRTTPIATLMQKREGGIPNDIAALRGARMVLAGETNQGAVLDEALIKILTGEDTISARFLHGEFFDFLPTFKLWLHVNHKPIIRGTDAGIRRRPQLVPFEYKVEKKDRELGDKLREEASGILAWAVRGWAEYQRIGLAPPKEVQEATQAYLRENDQVAEFVSECCEVGPQHGPTPHKALYKAYAAWCDEGGTHPKSSKNFAMELERKGFKRPARNGSEVTREGIALIRREAPYQERWGGSYAS